MTDKLHLPAGTTAAAPYSLVVSQEDAGWTYSGLRVLDLRPGERAELVTGEDELLVLPLAGSAAVTCDGERFELSGRASVFSAVSDLLYVPRDAHVVLESGSGGRFAMPAARCRRRLAPRYRPASEIPVELRGAGSCSRQVVDLCGSDWPYADKLIAVEVLTPGGNWSSYPPHKHDETSATETELEEIYYFEVAAGPSGSGLGYQRVYGTADRPLDVLAEVGTGDVVLVPHGWHGPSMAAPGYDLYYLNVMGGPGEDRAWRPCDDPAHAWVRDTWGDQQVDPRLPLTTATGGRS